MSELKALKDIQECLCKLIELQQAGNEPQIRRDVEILCDVSTPESPVPVIVRYEYATDGSSEVVATLNLDLTPYAGVITDLRACESEQARYDIEEKDFCVNGQSVIRVRVYDAEANSTAPVTEGWTNLLGATVPAPTGADIVSLGACVASAVLPYFYEACGVITATSEETTVRVFETRSDSGAVISRRLEDQQGNDVTATVTLSDCSSCCDLAEHCILADLFDNDSGFPVSGQSETFDILIDGVSQAVVNHDYLTSQTGTSKSSWYTPVIAAVNALPGWSMTLVSDVVLPANGKPTYRIEYTGSTAQTLRINKANSGDWTEYVADGSGTMTGNWSWSPDSTPFNACP